MRIMSFEMTSNDLPPNLLKYCNLTFLLCWNTVEFMKEWVATCMWMHLGGKWAEYAFPDLISVLSGPGGRTVLIDELDVISKGGLSGTLERNQTQAIWTLSHSPRAWIRSPPTAYLTLVLPRCHLRHICSKWLPSNRLLTHAGEPLPKPHPVPGKPFPTLREVFLSTTPAPGPQVPASPIIKAPLMNEKGKAIL